MFYLEWNFSKKNKIEKMLFFIVRLQLDFINYLRCDSNGEKIADEYTFTNTNEIDAVKSWSFKADSISANGLPIGSCGLTKIKTAES